MSNILELNNIHYEINHDIILSSVSFSLKEGSFGLILGQNGIGKTTLLKIIGGFIKDYQGDVINKSLRMSYLKQTTSEDNQGFFGTVEEMIKLGSKRKGQKTISQEECNQIIEYIGLTDVKKHLFDHLSGGQQERVKIGMMLASHPDLALLDEPTSGLDKDGKLWLNHCLRALNKQGTTLLIVTHEEEVFKDADWSIHFKDNHDYEIWDGENDVIL